MPQTPKGESKGDATLPGGGGQVACTPYTAGQTIHGLYYSSHLGVWDYRYGWHQCACHSGYCAWVFLGNY